MPNITDNPDNFPANIPYADDGDDADSASLEQSFQALGDRTAWLLKRLWGFGTATNQWIQIPLTPVVGSSWAMFEEPYTYRQQQLAGVAVIPIPSLLASMIIKQIRVRSRGRGGHSALPENMPSVQLFRQQPNSSAELIVSASDGSGSVSTYEAGSTIMTMTVPDDGLNTAQDEAYYLKLTGEYGTNALAAGWEVFSIWARIQGND